MDTIILGLDQSLANTGWSIFCLNKEASQLNLIKVGLIKTSPTNSLHERLSYIEQQVDSLIKTYLPNWTFTEVVFVNRSIPGDFINLIKVETTIQNYFYRNKIQYGVIDSLRNREYSWRKLFQLSGAKSESKALLMKTKLTLPQLNNHNADACLIALAGLVKHGLISTEELFTLLGLNKDSLNKDSLNKIAS